MSSSNTTDNSIIFLPQNEELKTDLIVGKSASDEDNSMEVYQLTKSVELIFKLSEAPNNGQSIDVFLKKDQCLIPVITIATAEKNVFKTQLFDVFDKHNIVLRNTTLSNSEHYGVE